MVIRKIAKYVVLIAVAIFFLTPVYVMVITSVKPLDEVSLSEMWTLPSAIDFASYSEAFTRSRQTL